MIEFGAWVAIPKDFLEKSGSMQFVRNGICLRYDGVASSNMERNNMRENRFFISKFWRAGALLGLVVPLYSFGEMPSVVLSAPTPDLQGALQVWSWNIAAASLRELLPGFHDRYPGVGVHIEMNGTNAASRFLLSLSAGVGAPDVAQLQAREVPRYTPTGKLTDLTEMAKPYEHAFVRSFWENCVYEGRIYAIPWDIAPCAVYYKRRLFEQYAINPESIETWDDYVVAGKELVARSKGKAKMLCLPTGGLNDLFEILLQQRGAQVFDESGRVAFNSPAAVDTLRLIRKLIDADIGANILPWSFEYFSTFNTDTVATYPMPSWFGGIIRDYAPKTAGDWGVFRLPAYAPGGLRTSNLGGSVLVVPTQSKQKEAAWAFIQHTLCTREAQMEQFRNFELFPGLISTHQDPFFDEPVPFFGGQQVRRLFALDIDRIPVLNRTTDWMEAVRYIQQALSQWTAGRNDTAEELAADVQERLCRRLNRAPASGIAP